MFEDQLIEIAKDEIDMASLWGPALKASKEPGSGITIQKKSAYYVIRDCATVTRMFLPNFIFGKLKNPFTKLAGKFNKKDVIDFIHRALIEIPQPATVQLLQTIVSELNKGYVTHLIDINLYSGRTVNDIVSLMSELDVKADEPNGNIYGDYELGETVVEKNNDYINFTDKEAVTKKLIEIFAKEK